MHCVRLYSYASRAKRIGRRHIVGGSEHWNDLQIKALCMAWFHVSAKPAGKGTSQTRDELFENILVTYHFFYKNLGGEAANPKKGVIFKPQTGKAWRNKWQAMNNCVTKFMSCDVLATHTLRRFGSTPANFRKDATKYDIQRHSSEFKFEIAYNYLKDKPKWLRDAGQHHTDGKAIKKEIKSTPAKDAEKIKASDSEDEVVRDKPAGQKRARVLMYLHHT